uniref:Uncharacterized protein n=1 Tax=Chromera velia CCMP2878 TaxID=1169474 RepID=A0A0G4HBP1_9ALVE|eukprot:Cvel_25876.t1-p1 / transcript=Cvel_25876.t1 / gene=Cvel_25876 / organism=Chromera_velia_CCMP2878 / gene_product=hypothetical protein / transcript_product=hypothetical protein / location=Cvel_scaffold2987:7784-10529(+) / protein_length=279 / sequence_SO=supercontig / SO=protein_coding / is_pseudo=false
MLNALGYLVRTPKVDQKKRSIDDRAAMDFSKIYNGFLITRDRFEDYRKKLSKKERIVFDQWYEKWVRSFTIDFIKGGVSFDPRLPPTGFGFVQVHSNQTQKELTNGEDDSTICSSYDTLGRAPTENKNDNRGQKRKNAKAHSAAAAAASAASTQATNSNDARAKTLKAYEREIIDLVAKKPDRKTSLTVIGHTVVKPAGVGKLSKFIEKRPHLFGIDGEEISLKAPSSAAVLPALLRPPSPRRPARPSRWDVKDPGFSAKDRVAGGDRDRSRSRSRERR